MANAYKWAEEARVEEEAAKSRVYLLISVVGLELPTELRTCTVTQKLKIDLEIADDDTVLDLKLLVIAALKLPKSMNPIFWRECEEEIIYLHGDAVSIRSFGLSRNDTVHFKLFKVSKVSKFTNAS